MASNVEQAARVSGMARWRWTRAAVLLAGASLSCASGPRAAVSAPRAPAAAGAAVDPDDRGLGFAWFSGSVDEALAASRAQRRPLFLYWGAVWCPPCLALKHEVFPAAAFAERMRSFIPVHIDGDAEDAQRWADRFAVASYPAMLVLDADGHERMRLLGAAELGEVDAALAAALREGSDLRERAAEAQRQPEALSASDWTLLSLTTWVDAANEPPGGFAPVLATVAALAERVPRAEVEAAARLAGAALQLAADFPGDRAGAGTLIGAVAGRCAGLLDAMLGGPRQVLAARGPILEASAAIEQLCRPAVGAGLGDRLVAAARSLGADPTLPVEVRIEARIPEAALWRQAHGGAAPSPEARRRIVDEVQALLALPGEAALRHTVVDAASSALRAAGDEDGARAVLLAELPRSRVPWYILGELAAIAGDRGDVDEALRRSAEAVGAAAGRATQIQWRVAELKLLLKLRPGVADAELLPRLRGLYERMSALPDGYAGRNRRRLKLIAAALPPAAVAVRPALRALLVEERARCAGLPADRRAVCEGHFDGLLRPAGPG